MEHSMGETTTLMQWFTSRFVRAEDGMALVLALVIMVILFIAAGTATGLVTSNQSTSNHERQGVQALTGGEAGLDQAANWVVTNDPTGSYGNGTVTLPTPAGSTVGGNSVALTATKAAVGGKSQWTLNSTTTSPNGKVVRVLQEKMQSIATPGSPAAFWGYGFVMGGTPNPGGYNAYQICENGSGPDKPTVFGGSGKVTVPVWIGGDVCTSGGEHPIGNESAALPINVHIGGFLYGSNGPREIVGSSTSPGPVADFEALGGCYSNHYSNTLPYPGCDTYSGGPTGPTKDGVFASSFNPIPSVTPPTLSAAQEQTMYASASPGPMNPCGVGSTGTIPTNLFESAGSTIPDASLGTKNFITQLLGPNAFDCKTSTGDLAWTPPVSHGAKACLHVTGSAGVFFDASVTMGGADYIQIDTNGVNGCTGATYPDGPTNGSIYLDGTLVLSNDASICSKTDFNASGTSCTIPLTGATIPSLFFSVYDRSGAAPAFSMPGNSRFESSAFVNGQYSLTNGGSASSVGGSIFANYASVTGGSSFSVSTVVPAGSLGNPSSSSAWSLTPSSWRECPVSGCS